MSKCLACWLLLEIILELLYKEIILQQVLKSTSSSLLNETIPAEDLLQVLVLMDLINPCKLWSNFCCEMLQWIVLEVWFCGSMQVQCMYCINAWGWLCEGKKKSMCIFNFYGHCPNTPYRGSASSQYTPMMSDLSPHHWANFLIGASLWVEEDIPSTVFM